jgi:hypothetical protein
MGSRPELTALRRSARTRLGPMIARAASTRRCCPSSASPRSFTTEVHSGTSPFRPSPDPYLPRWPEAFGTLPGSQNVGLPLRHPRRGDWCYRTLTRIVASSYHSPCAAFTSAATVPPRDVILRNLSQHSAHAPDPGGSHRLHVPLTGGLMGMPPTLDRDGGHGQIAAGCGIV